jgi:hypothetical protein
MTGMARNLREDLVVLRNLREDRSVHALRLLQRECDDAEASLGRERRQLDAWRCHADEEEAALYAALLRQPLGRCELERVLVKVDALRCRTRALERGVESACEAKDRAQAALRQGQTVRAAAARATRKAIEVLSAHRRQCAVALERSAEDALDEIATLMHGRNPI